MDDAHARRHNAEVLERLLRPAQQRVALAVSLVLAVDVGLVGAIGAEARRPAPSGRSPDRPAPADRPAAASPPRRATAARIAARSTTAGTPVRSCMITRAGMNASCAPGRCAGQAASARTSASVTCSVPTRRSRFSSRTHTVYGSGDGSATESMRWTTSPERERVAGRIRIGRIHACNLSRREASGEGRRAKRRRHPDPIGSRGQARTPRSAARAANQPHMPCTPPPGGVDAEHRKSRRSGVAYGFRRATGPGERAGAGRRAAVDVAADVVRVVGARASAGACTCRARTRSRKPGAKRSICASIALGHVDRRAVAARGSRPSSVCLPAGARVGSNRLCCATSTNGRSAMRPCHDVAPRRPRSPRACRRGARSPARAASRRRPRHRAVERVVDLERRRARSGTARRRAPVARRQRGRRRCAASCARRDVEQHGPRRRELVERAHAASGLDLAAERREDATPARRRSPASRRAANGQPTAWREQRRARARTRRVSGAHRAAGSSGPRIPAKSARAGVAAERAGRARDAERSAEQPEARPGSGCAGSRSGAEQRRRAASASRRRAGRSDVRVGARRRAPSAAAVSSSERVEQRPRAPPSSGCASGDVRMDPLEAVSSSGERAQERRRQRERVDRRADVVDETRAA